MQNVPSQVSSGNIAPKILGPQKETREVVFLSGMVLCLGGVLAAAWYYGQNSDRIPVTPSTEQSTNVSEVIKNASSLSQAGVSSTTPFPVAIPIVSPMDDVIHADIYFEVGRKGLTEEAKAQLSTRAELLKDNQDYGILIQGYTDQQGSASYNNKLGLSRAEAVKTELVNAGVATHRMKAMSLGEEGVLCVDSSDICRHVNRRVHLEIRKFGQQHMAIPAAAVSSDPSEAGIDASSHDQDTGRSIKGFQPLNPEPTQGS